MVEDAANAPGRIATPNAHPDLLDATADQQQRFASAFRLIDDAIARRVFPGAALAVTLRGRLLALHAFGRATYAPDAPAVAANTPWDLASLTKPIATTSMAMLLFERGKLSLDAKLADLLPNFATAIPSPDTQQLAWRRSVTVRMLLAHSSGLPAHRKLYLDAQGREAILAAALRVPLDHPPMQHAEYSDIGFILLGSLLESIAGESLNAFCSREFFAPLNLNLTFYPQHSDAPAIPPTVNDTEYRHRIIQGEVNDENASAMGGVAGHAGLFGDALSVVRFAECILRGGTPIFQPETVALFTTRQQHPEGTSRTLGWDTPSAPSQSGTHFSPRSFGHLGYTGTSLWCDPDRHLAVALLTNRTWPDAHNQSIKQLRPLIHDAILNALENNSES